MWSFRRPKLKKARRPVTSAKRTHYHRHREQAREHIAAKLAYFNQYYQLSYNRVAIRNQRRCWGSCSAKRNLNFSYKLLFLPECLRDYIIVHELCHLRELNHSVRFWAAVEEVLPDYAERSAVLRKFERTHGTSVTALQMWQRNHDNESCAFCANMESLPRPVVQSSPNRVSVL